jgi:hypothetical protein
MTLEGRLHLKVPFWGNFQSGYEEALQFFGYPFHFFNLEFPAAWSAGWNRIR